MSYPTRYAYHFVDCKMVESVTGVYVMLAEYDKLRDRLAAAEESHSCTYKQLLETADRLVAAEAELRAASEQEPKYWISAKSGAIYGKNEGSFVYGDTPLYAAPVPPADVHELQIKSAEAEKELIVKDMQIDALCDRAEGRDAHIRELERRLAEQQAHIQYAARCFPSTLGHYTGFGRDELNTLLAKAREEGRLSAVPDGWQVVPKGPTPHMAISYALCGSGLSYHGYAEMLAAAPTPD